jgi:Tat protein translocase TatB subunit
MALAIIFDSVGAGEWLVLLAVLLVVMGPKRLPSTARTIGSYYSKFRRAAESFKRQLMDMDYEMERELEKARREAEAAMTVPDDPPEFDENFGAADSSSEETPEAAAETAADTAADDDGNKPS